MAFVQQLAADRIFVVVRNVAVVDAIDDVLERTLPGRSADPRHAGALRQVQRGRLVAPGTGVVDHDGVLDAVGRIVDLVRPSP